MHRIPHAAVVASLCLSATACMTVTPVVNSVDLTQVDFSQPMRRGEACETWVLGLGPFGGTASVVEAVEKAAIATVKVVDYEHRWYVIARQSCIVVHGTENWSGS